jgi:phospholipase C
MRISRRGFLRGTAYLGAAAASSAFLPRNLRNVLASTDAPTRGTGQLSDIKHVVILMQENRSFDEYFGTLAGVRGFGTKNVKLPNGNSIFEQPDPAHADGFLLPFRYDTANTSAQATPGLAHTWTTQHKAWDSGAMDMWVAAKGGLTMGYFEPVDIPFHTALAQTFTVLDGYHCSVLGPTNPNRLYMWSGTIDPEGGYGGPIIDDSPAHTNPICKWTTYPERLQAAGVTWRIYQERDNYDDNALEWFEQFATADHDSPLYENGMVKMPAGWFEHDALTDNLPQVSWLVAPSAQCEHPNWMPAAGAQYIASKIDAIAANPDVWAKTVFILTYDENDGSFDHVPPPTAPAGTADEFVDGEPIGLGFRVPTIIVSPWTVGGGVFSDVADHASLILLLEQIFGVEEPNISAWRRRTVSNMTGIFGFDRPSPFPQGNRALSVSTTTSNLLIAQHEVAVNPAPTVPTTNTWPVQQPAFEMI